MIGREKLMLGRGKLMMGIYDNTRVKKIKLEEAYYFFCRLIASKTKLPTQLLFSLALCNLLFLTLPSLCVAGRDYFSQLTGGAEGAK